MLGTCHYREESTKREGVPRYICTCTYMARIRIPRVSI